MSARIGQHIRSNVVGYVALFVALSGAAYAVDGPLPGQDQVGSDDIINAEVKTADLGPESVRSGKVLDETLVGADIAPGAISTSEVINGTIGAADLGSNSVGYEEIAPSAFNTEIADSGFFYGIADNAIQGNEVSDNSLTGADIDETTLTALDGNDAHDQTCDPETTSYLHCVDLSFTAGQPMSILLLARYQYHGIEDNPLGTCRTTLDGATVSSSKLFNSDHTSEIGGSAIDVVSVDAGAHTFGFDCFEFGPDDHDLVVTEIDLAEVQLGID
jgi:hypothetical protein